MPPHQHDQLVSKKAGPLVGTMPIPGDKSISHRSLIFGSLAIGTTKVYGLFADFRDQILLRSPDK